MTSEPVAPPAPDDLTAVQREELLRRSWMANDGLWFYQTALARGVDGANATNAEVVREFGRQEMRRLMGVLGVETVETVEQYRRLFDTAVGLYLGSLFDYADELGTEGHTIEVTTCFAYKGVKRAGIDKLYHCGPGERLLGWLDAMGLPPDLDPQVGLCQMAHTGACSYRVGLSTLPAS